MTRLPQARRHLAQALSGAFLLAACGWAGAATTFTVSAHDNWVYPAGGTPLDTGLVLGVGDHLDISASGTWNGGDCGDVAPTGSPCYPNIVPGAPTYSLVARVGSGDLFEVGTHYAGVPGTGGHLFLGFADINGFDNSGSVLATVNVSAVPEPATTALTLAGLGALGLVARRRRRFLATSA